MRLFLFILVILGFALPVQAQDNPAPEPTRLEVDQEANVVRVIIDGNVVAQFTSSGLMVIGDVEYGGIIKDRGRQSITEAIDTSTVTKGEGDAP